MKNILAFGDSNTWGLVPGSSPLKRYPLKIRWTGILQSLSEDIRVIEEGLCGRTTVFEDALRPGRKGVESLPLILESQSPLDGVILMLGTNDCKTVYGASAYTIGIGIRRCLDDIERFVRPSSILLISPLHLGEDVWREDKDPEFDKRSVKISHDLKSVYEKIAAERGTAFLAASDIVTASSIDDEHMDEEGHELFANEVYKKLKKEGIV